MPDEKKKAVKNAEAVAQEPKAAAEIQGRVSGPPENPFGNPFGIPPVLGWQKHSRTEPGRTCSIEVSRMVNTIGSPFRASRPEF